MPLKAGSSQETISKNISEFHTGKTYAATKAKFGKKKADKQAIAVAMSTARKYGKKGKKKATGGTVEQPPPDITIKADDEPEEGTDAYYARQEERRGVPESQRHYGDPVRVLPRRGRPLIPGKALGGPNIGMESLLMHGASRGLHQEGMIHSSIPGRTDRLPMNVRAGSYVLPADIPSALGQGNSAAGGQILKSMFSSGPYGMKTMHSAGRSGMSLAPRLPRAPAMRQPRVFQFGGPINIEYPRGFPEIGRAAWQYQNQRQRGGEAEGGDSHVPIIAAGGEYIIHPEVVRDIGHGNIKHGHNVLDKFVLKVRARNIKTLKKLPGPKA